MMNKQRSITIAICTYNRAEYLKDTLKDLSGQTADFAQFEILVINNNSSDHTEEVCREFAGQNQGVNFRWVNEMQQGLSNARNRAFKEAHFEAILYIDDDVYLPANFVETALDYQGKYPEMKTAGGRIFVSFDDAEPDWVPRELMPMFGLHDLGDRGKNYPRTNFPRGGNMLIHKQVFDRTGLFDPQLGRIGTKLTGSEEKAFFERARKKGFTPRYLPKLKLSHRIAPARLQRRYLENQSIGIGRSERQRMDSRRRVAGKLISESIKLAGSFVLAAFYLLKGKTKAARFILVFRFWVMKGFLSGKQF